MGKIWLRLVSPSFQTSVPFLPKYFGVVPWVSSPAFQLTSMQYGTEWTETLTSSIFSDIQRLVFHLLFIHSFSILSDDRSKASYETIPPYNAIQGFIFQMRVSSPVLKVIQQFLTSSSSSSCHFHLSLYLSFDNLFEKAVST